MFFVVNKDKLMAFFVACSTVFVLFMMTSMFEKTSNTTIETVETSKQLTTQTEEEDSNKIESNQIKTKQ